ncbi:MAG: hypothetical protein FJW32_17410 [Acidobacteria bacterium]|nr:hypothetical protein [Acidobacteriota bacterium]
MYAAIHMLWIISGAAQDCVNCHRAIVDKHAATNHARTLRPLSDTAFGRALPDRPIGEARGGFLLSYMGTTVSAERGRESAAGEIAWVLGAGDQGLTPLVKIGGEWLEHRISYYPRADRFDLTLGHQPGTSKSAKAALGIVQSEATVKSCLGCHGAKPPGLGCESCHVKTAEHFSRPTKLCTECHRKEGPDDALAIRFQPLRLIKSACFTKGRIACANCHPPHANAVRNDAAFYRSKCAACHSTEHANQPADCLPCHMPKSSPAPYLSFTDHWIRKRR